jgi:hypothetical protein
VRKTGNCDILYPEKRVPEINRGSAYLLGIFTADLSIKCYLELVLRF